MLYLRFILFCFKILFELKHYKGFLNYDGSKGKSYRLETKSVDQKVKMAKKKGLQPKKEHVFLSMFYSSMEEEEAESRRKEMTTLFCLLYLWHYSLNVPESDPSIEDKE